MKFFASFLSVFHRAYACNIYFIYCRFVFKTFCSNNGSNQATQSIPKPNKRADYYPLWRHVQIISRCGGGGSWEWRCNLCKSQYKGSYPRVKAHFLHESGKGIENCPKTNDPVERRKYQSEQDEADKLKRKHDQLSNATPQAPDPSIEPRIV